MTPSRGRTWTAGRMAAGLLDAADSGAGLAPLTAEWPELDLETAYAIQDEILRLRLDRGERLIGVKLGQLGMSSPVTGWLTDAMVVPSGDGRVPLGRLIRPRAAPEIVFQMSTRLAGPGVTAAGAQAAVAAVRGAVEVIDSRYTSGEVRLPDVIADNASACCFMTGPVSVPPTELDLTLEACLLDVDGQIVDSATGAAVHGNPAEALALAANALAKRGLAIQGGWLVLTGGMTEPVPYPPGTTLSAHFTTLASIFLPTP
jgi:2-oxo-3-hexenedioate decarboxylase